MLIHLKNTCEVVVTDCASAEILAQDMGRGARQGTGLASDNLFRNVKIVGRDRAHACQRLLSRPWISDYYVKLLMEDSILGSDSACQFGAVSDARERWALPISCSFGSNFVFPQMVLLARRLSFGAAF